MGHVCWTTSRGEDGLWVSIVLAISDWIFHVDAPIPQGY